MATSAKGTMIAAIVHRKLIIASVNPAIVRRVQMSQFNQLFYSDDADDAPPKLWKITQKYERNPSMFTLLRGGCFSTTDDALGVPAILSAASSTPWVSCASTCLLAASQQTP